MANFGMTNEGFVPKRTADIYTDLNTGIASIKDQETGARPFQNISDDSVLQQIIGVFAEGLAECWNAAYEASVQFDPLKNTGAGQSATVQLNAMLRKAGTYTKITLTLTGTANTSIPAGSRVSALNRDQTFVTDFDVIIPASGEITVTATDTVKSDAAPEPGTVARIDTPISGWRTASNTGLISAGSFEETDEELRVRQQRSTSLTSYRIIDAIHAAVVNVPGVIYARAYQNSKTYPADDRGIPFKEVSVVVEGGDPREIADAIYLRLPTGQIGYGNTTEVFYDDFGVATPISFSRPEEVPVYVDVVLSVTNRTDFPDDYEAKIKQYIIDYAQYSGSINGEAGFPPGVNIVRTRLYTPVNLVPGHRIESLTIGTSLAGMGTNDIAVGWDEVGRFEESRITVTVL